MSSEHCDLSPHWSPGQPSCSFLTQINCSPMWALWSCGRRTSVVQAQRQIHRVAGPVHRLWPENASSDRDCGTTVDGIVPLRCDPWLEPILSTAALMPAEPHIRSAVARTAGTTIPHSGGHRAREGGSTLYVGISQPLFVTVRAPGSNGADQALVELAIMLYPAKLRRPTRGRGQ